ncbi:hypothetical protein K6025_00310 [Ehrlichia sp. JZT12]
MLVKSIVSIAIAIASSMGLTSFLNNTREETSDLSVKDVVIRVAYATLTVMVIRFIVKLVYGNKEVEKQTSEVKRSKKRNQKVS